MVETQNTNFGKINRQCSGWISSEIPENIPYVITLGDLQEIHIEIPPYILNNILHEVQATERNAPAKKQVQLSFRDFQTCLDE